MLKTFHRVCKRACVRFSTLLPKTSVDLEAPDFFVVESAFRLKVEKLLSIYNQLLQKLDKLADRCT